MPIRKKIIPPEAAYQKLTDYCSRQERSRSDVMKKLYAFGIVKDVADQIILRLEKENYLNEERYAQLYAGGKSRIKKWGKRKIEFELSRKGVPSSFIENGIELIEDNIYLENLRNLLEKKWKASKEPDLFKRKQKVMAYLGQKGYEMELVIKEFERFGGKGWNADDADIL